MQSKAYLRIFLLKLKAHEDEILVATNNSCELHLVVLARYLERLNINGLV